MHIESFFEPVSATFSHVLHGHGPECAVIDPVLDYDYRAGRYSTHSADQLLAYIRQHQLQVQWILETHVHADHLSAAAYIKQHAGGQTAIGAQVCQVQALFKPIFDLEPEFPTDGSQFDRLLHEGDRLALGELTIEVWHTPGHTPACVSYKVEEALFVGDVLFMPDVGSARCDFPGGNAHALYASVQRIYALPESTRLILCHDYPPAGRELSRECSVAESRRANMDLRAGISEAEFVAQRQARDAAMDMPSLILPALQVNVRAGELPAPAANGRRYLKIPLNSIGRA